MWRTLLLPVLAGFIAWGSLQLKIYIEGKMEESRAKKSNPKQKIPEKVYDHKWDEE